MSIPENATYTAADMRVLTEAALRLGRKEAGEEIAEAIEFRRDEPDGIREACEGMSRVLMTLLAEMARNLASQPVPEPRTGASGYSDRPQDSQAGRGPQGGVSS